MTIKHSVTFNENTMTHFHRVVKLTIELINGLGSEPRVKAVVNSYVDEAHIPTGHVMWQTYPVLPLGIDLGSNPLEAAEQYLISAESGDFVGGSFVPYGVPGAEPNIDSLRQTLLADVNTRFTSAAETLTQGYPLAERQTWHMQQAEAIAWHTDPTAATPYLDSIAEARGIDYDDMRQRTYENVAKFMRVSAVLVGQRQALVDSINAATTAQDLQTIRDTPAVWDISRPADPAEPTTPVVSPEEQAAAAETQQSIAQQATADEPNRTASRRTRRAS